MTVQRGDDQWGIASLIGLVFARPCLAQDSSDLLMTVLRSNVQWGNTTLSGLVFARPCLAQEFE
jgi:hypothetical protein